MIQIFKHEIAANYRGRLQIWTFYWRVNVISGRNDKQVANDIADALEGILGWFQRFRALWDQTAFCRRYRLRRVDTPGYHWQDLYWRFVTYTGVAITRVGAIELRCVVRWFTDPQVKGAAATHLGMIVFDAMNSGIITGLYPAAANEWAVRHYEEKVTAYGDTFKPVIRDVAGNWCDIIDHFTDRREATSRPGLKV